MNGIQKTNAYNQVRMNAKSFLDAYKTIFGTSNQQTLRGWSVCADEEVILLADGYVGQDSIVPCLPVYRVFGMISGISIESIFFSKEKYINFCNEVGLVH